MTRMPITWLCAGCGAPAPMDHGVSVPFQCPNRVRRDGVDHVLRRDLDLPRLAWPDEQGEANPFVRYRRLLTPWHLAVAQGLDDSAFKEIVTALDGAVESVDGRGFLTTPLVTADGLDRALGFDAAGGVWVKNETGGVSGSHKARHLGGIMLLLLVIERLRPAQGARPPLTIASCGNAALTAAIVAKGAGWPLHVFVPPSAEAAVLARLSSLGASVTMCSRAVGELGDPCYLRFREELGAGALPFCCQGPDSSVTIEGGQTLAWEMVDSLGGTSLDRLFVQVGGGALASACIQGLLEARRLGRLGRMPRIHAVQTRGAYPLWRAWSRVIDAAGTGGTLDTGAASRDDNGLTDARLPDPHADAARAAGAGTADRLDRVVGLMRQARAHRSSYMWPWEEEPHSIAHGILDDETYDWAAVVEGMLMTGGWPVVVDEGGLCGANDLGRRTTGIDVDHTGSAGLAGLVAMRKAGLVGAAERVAVIFSGVRRE